MQQQPSMWHSPTNKIAHVQSPTINSRFTILTLCMLGNFLYFLWAADCFYKIILFQKIIFRNTIRVSNILDADQARHYVRPDLRPNCLQRLLADDISKQRIKVGMVFGKK